MANSIPAFKPIIGTGALDKLIHNITLVDAGTEYSQLLANKTKGLIIRSRSLNEVKIAFVSGETVTNYITLKAGAVFSVDNIEWENSTVYLSSDSSGVVVELLQLYT